MCLAREAGVTTRPSIHSDFRLVADRALSQAYRSGLILDIYRRCFGRFSKKWPPIFDALYHLDATLE